MMKKYICYILPVFLLLPILGALGVWSQKNNMQIGLRKTADGEFDVTGDPSAIKNLSYQFMVTDYLNVWQVTGQAIGYGFYAADHMGDLHVVWLIKSGILDGVLLDMLIEYR